MDATITPAVNYNIAVNKKGFNISIWIVAVTLYYIVFQLSYNLMVFGNIMSYANLHEFIRDTAINYSAIMLVALFNWVVVFKIPTFKNIYKKIACDFIASFGLLILFNMVMTWVTGSVEWGGTIFNNFLLFLSTETIYYMLNFRRQVKDVEESQRRELEYKYSALKAHINPHFLFNSFNILYSLIPTDSLRAQEFTMALSDLYRYIVDKQEKTEVFLSEELEFMNRYVDVLKIRHPNQIDMEIEGIDNIRDHTIIPFTLQLLIENIIKHNVISAVTPMKIKVRIGESDFSVSNPKAPKVSAGGSAFGFKYLVQMYERADRHLRIDETQNNYAAIIPYIR